MFDEPLWDGIHYKQRPRQTGSVLRTMGAIFLSGSNSNYMCGKGVKSVALSENWRLKYK